MILNPKFNENKKIVIDYTNWKGERSIRTVTPRQMFWGSTNYHPDNQWLLNAFDEEKQDERTFAMRDIHSWSSCLI